MEPRKGLSDWLSCWYGQGFDIQDAAGYGTVASEKRMKDATTIPRMGFAAGMDRKRPIFSFRLRRNSVDLLRSPKGGSRTQVADAGPARLPLLHQGLAADYAHSGQPYVGSFRQTEQVRAPRSLAVALALDARAVLFQCPKSFLPTSENLIHFGGLLPAGWTAAAFGWRRRPVAKPGRKISSQELCADYDLIHCVDPFEARSFHGGPSYWRLH